MYSTHFPVLRLKVFRNVCSYARRLDSLSGQGERERKKPFPPRKSNKL